MDELTVEATGETVGEAKWKALRDLERLAPGLDRASVRFQVVSEGERGLLGVGFTPARVVASADAPAGVAAPPAEEHDESELAAHVRQIVERVGLEPMTSVERKVVHEYLKEIAGVETASEGTEPNRYVVVFPG